MLLGDSESWLLVIGSQDFMNYDGISNLKRAKNISIGSRNALVLSFLILLLTMCILVIQCHGIIYIRM